MSPITPSIIKGTEINQFVAPIYSMMPISCLSKNRYIYRVDYYKQRYQQQQNEKPKTDENHRVFEIWIPAAASLR